MILIAFALALLTASSLLTFAPSDALPISAEALSDSIWLAHFGLIFISTYYVWQLKLSKQADDLLKEQREETLKLNGQVQQALKDTKLIANEKDTLEQKNAELKRNYEAQRLELKKEREILAKKEAQLAELVKKQSSAESSENSQADVIAFLGLLQKQGRFLDFVMNDITKYSNEQVSTASRIVHQGCSKVLSEYFDIQPIFEGMEGSSVDLTKTDNRKIYKIIGKKQDDNKEESFSSAYLLHKGWQTLSINLPKRINSEYPDLKVIAPAELEIRN